MYDDIVKKLDRYEDIDIQELDYLVRNSLSVFNPVYLKRIANIESDGDTSTIDIQTILPLETPSISPAVMDKDRLDKFKNEEYLEFSSFYDTKISVESDILDEFKSAIHNIATIGTNMGYLVKIQAELQFHFGGHYINFYDGKKYLDEIDKSFKAHAVGISESINWAFDFRKPLDKNVFNITNEVKRFYDFGK